MSLDTSISNYGEIKIEEETLIKSILSAIRWLVESGIQNNAGDISIHGGFNAFFNQETQSYPYVYAEATGYALCLFAYLSKNYQAKKTFLIERGNMACNWLLNNLDDNGLINHSYILPNGPLVTEQYIFDAAICGMGLLRYQNLVKDKCILEKAKQIAIALTKLQKPDGSLPAVVPESHSGDRWSRRFNVHHAKVAMFLVEAADIFKDSSFIESALKICRLILHQQSHNGFFKINDKICYVHPHCYACEGLLCVGRKLKEAKIEESGVRGISWLAHFQNLDGSINQWFPGDGTRANDSLAQSLRLWFVSDKNRFSACIYRGIEILTRQQYLQGPKSVYGGFRYSSTIRDVNSWTTIFAIAALVSYVNQDTTIYDLF